MPGRAVERRCKQQGGVILGLVPRIPVGSSAGHAADPHDARTRILGTSPRMTSVSSIRFRGIQHAHCRMAVVQNPHSQRHSNNLLGDGRNHKSSPIPHLLQHPRTHMREVQETSETLDVGALAGVAIEASARRGVRISLRTAQRGSPAGSVPWDETNFDGTASGGCETGGTRGTVG